MIWFKGWLPSVFIVKIHVLATDRRYALALWLSFIPRTLIQWFLAPKGLALPEQVIIVDCKMVLVPILSCPSHLLDGILLSVKMYFLFKNIMSIFLSYILFLTMSAACGYSQARDWTHVTAVTRATAVTMPDPSLAEPPGNPLKSCT